LAADRVSIFETVPCGLLAIQMKENSTSPLPMSGQPVVPVSGSGPVLVLVVVVSPGSVVVEVVVSPSVAVAEIGPVVAVVDVEDALVLVLVLAPPVAEPAVVPSLVVGSVPVSLVGAVGSGIVVGPLVEPAEPPPASPHPRITAEIETSHPVCFVIGRVYHRVRGPARCVAPAKCRA